jgi:hypothetical protein
MGQVGEGEMAFNDISFPFLGREIRIGRVKTKKGDPGREPESPF